MWASDVTETLTLALALALHASGCDRAEAAHKPRLLSDNGPSYIASDPRDWLEDRGMDHVRGAPNHPQTQGKIVRSALFLRSEPCQKRIFPQHGSTKVPFGRMGLRSKPQTETAHVGFQDLELPAPRRIGLQKSGAAGHNI